MRDDTATTRTPEDAALAGFLARYRGTTRKLYESDVRMFYTWCTREGIAPIQASRAQVEMFGRYLEDERHNQPSSVARRLGALRMFFRVAVADELILRDPTAMLRMPKVHRDPEAIAWLNRTQMGALLKAARETSPAHEALVALMGMLGLRVSEACGLRIEDYAEDALGYRVLHVMGKGDKPATMPVPIPVLRVLERARGDRTSGPLILRRNGDPQDRHGAYAWIRQLAAKAGVPAAVHPHSLRHSAITAALDSGLDIRDAQIFARHSDPRTTTRYDRSAHNLDRHGAHAVARIFASAA